MGSPHALIGQFEPPDFREDEDWEVATRIELAAQLELNTRRRLRQLLAVGVGFEGPCAHCGHDASIHIIENHLVMDSPPAMCCHVYQDGTMCGCTTTPIHLIEEDPIG